MHGWMLDVTHGSQFTVHEHLATSDFGMMRFTVHEHLDFGKLTY